MRTVFPSYPDGAAGAGLFVLRASVTLSLQTTVSRFDYPDWRHLAAALLALGVMLGLRTRLFAGLMIVMAISALAGGAGLIVIVPLMLDACALVLVGPGAYSADARLFGRRTVILPARSEE